MTLDDLRVAQPELGFAVYAYDPRGAVTLEVLAPTGETFTFKATTEAAAIEKAFPPPPPEPETNIFD